MLSLAKTILLLFLVYSFGISGYASSFNEALFENQKYNHYLAFDLSTDESPKAALIVKSNLGIGHYTTNIPFASKDVEKNPSLYSTSGNYDNNTLLDFDITASSPALSAISFIPIMTDYSDEEILSKGYSENKLYLIKRGLERHFVFNYEELEYQKKLYDTSRAKNELVPQSIAVILPSGANGIEIRNTRKTNIPDPIYQVNNTYFYPYSNPASGEKLLEIKYLLKETPLQQFVVDALVKLILAVIPSGVGLLLMQSEEIVNSRLRKNGLIFCGILVVLLITGILIYSFVYQDQSARKSIVDIGVVIVASIFAGLVFFVKRKGADGKTTSSPGHS